MTHSKSIIRKLAALLVGALLILTFFSNTIFSLNLPGVVVGSPRTGVATTTFRQEGFVDFPSGASLHTDNAGRINFAVGRGDIVSPGDVLFSLQEDTEQLLERLTAEQGRLQRVLVNLASARSDLAFEESRLAGMTLDDITTIVPPLNLTRFDNEQRQLETEIEQAVEAYAAYRILFEAGAVPRTTVTRAAERIEALRESLQINIMDREREIQEHERITRQAEDAGQRTFIAEQQASRLRIEGFRHSIRLLEMDEQDVLSSLEQLYAQAEAGGLSTVYAQHYGVVREIPAGLESGAYVESNRMVMRLGLREYDSYAVTVYFPDSVGRLPEGALQDVRIDIPALEEHGIQGKIQRMSAAYGRVRVEISFATTANITGGERAVVIIEHFSALSGEMLPNSAIREDTRGYYVLVVEGERNTLLGYSFYARQHRITVQDRGDRSSAITALPAIELPVIIISDRPVEAESRVRVVGDQ